MSAASGDRLPLAGVRVVALEQAVAAPLATRHLADLGAEVIKIERVGEGDFARGYDDAVRGLASHFVWLNRGKKSVALDVKTPRGRAIVTELVAEADVFIQNLAPGAAARLGLDADTLRRDHPRLVVVDLSGYGSAGPKAAHKAYDMLIQAETGLISITGTPDEQAKTGIPVSDIAAGMYVVTSVLGALFRRERSGEGAAIEVSMFDATAEWLGHPMYLQMYSGRQVPRMGVSHAAIAPYDAYPTSDGSILIGVQNDRGWERLCREALADAALAEDARFRTNMLRVQHRHECDGEVARRTRQWRTAELETRLAAAGVPAAQINDVSGLIDHPQLSERDRWRTADTETGPVRALLPPMTFADVELPTGAVPALGQHTAEVLAARCGVDESGYQALKEQGVVP
ncbi:CaiB/BaiF CoA transferase family protein [Nocardioides sp. Iso805N]|uniref:CaiB/BaiF CoA transferase family protein n=1 Tax=Nocardioides sp. Iso805N TaxID=1283287 RepID=UPI00035C0E7F|nr:CaiB/BaiF CoA-transferase family protein [Nocardioides sp. Iso805N]